VPFPQKTRLKVSKSLFHVNFVIGLKPEPSL
jgi:hypothetical protein